MCADTSNNDKKVSRWLPVRNYELFEPRLCLRDFSTRQQFFQSVRKTAGVPPVVILLHQRGKPAKPQVHSCSSPCRPRLFIIVFHVLHEHLAHFCVPGYSSVSLFLSTPSSSVLMLGLHIVRFVPSSKPSSPSNVESVNRRSSLKELLEEYRGSPVTVRYPLEPSQRSQIFLKWRIYGAVLQGLFLQRPLLPTIAGILTPPFPESTLRSDSPLFVILHINMLHKPRPSS